MVLHYVHRRFSAMIDWIIRRLQFCTSRCSSSRTTHRFSPHPMRASIAIIGRPLLNLLPLRVHTQVIICRRCTTSCSWIIRLVLMTKNLRRFATAHNDVILSGDLESRASQVGSTWSCTCRWVLRRARRRGSSRLVRMWLAGAIRACRLLVVG